MDRRNWLLTAASLAAAGCRGALVAKDSAPRVVTIHSRKFEFVPADISLVRGEPVVLELVADDIDMGFRCKGLNLNVAMVAGKPTRVEFTPQAAGRFIFFCDVFCGD